MALDRLTKVDGGGISTTSDYRVGIITATKFVGPIEGDVTGSITATEGTFSGNVTIGGTLTYEDVTNIDSVGIITARDGIDCNGDLDIDGHTNLDNVSIAGVTTFSDDVKFTGNNYNVLWDKSDNSLKFDALAKIKLNDSFQFYHNTNGVLHNTSGTTYIYGSGSGAISLMAQPGSQNISCNPNANTSLYYANDQKLYTVSDGVYINDDLGIQDSIKHILDTNTKIRFPANDTISFETAGGERLRINSTGQIITNGGSANPFPTRAATFQPPSGQTNCYISIVSGSTSGTSGLTFGDGADNNAANYAGMFEYRHNTDTLAYMQNGSEKLRITSGGNILIGKTSSAGKSLEVYQAGDAAIRIQNNASGTGNTDGILLEIGNTSKDALIWNYESAPMRFGTAGTERLRIRADGNVNIGAGSGNQSALVPVLQLHKASSSATSYLHITNTDSGVNVTDGFLIGLNASNDALVYNKESTPLRFATANTERFRITSAGHLSFGASDITKTWSLGKAMHFGVSENALWGEGDYAFHMMQNAYYNSGWKYTHTDEASLYSSADGKHIFYTAASGSADSAITWSERFRITSGGQIGIGTATIRNNRAIQFTGESNSLFLITGHAPSICLNRDPDDSTDGDRSFFGVSSVSNGFANGTAAGDTIIRGNSSGKIHLATSTSIRMSIASGGDTTFFGSNVSLTVGTLYIPDSLVHYGDNNTKIRFPINDTITFETAGSEKLRITSGGHMGLGDNAPAAFTNYTNFSIHGASGGAITFGDDGTDEWEIYGGDGSLRVYDRTNSTERLRITDGGRVGINKGGNPGHILDVYNEDGSDCLRLDTNASAAGSNKQNAIRFSTSGTVRAHVGVAVDAGRLMQHSVSNDFCVKTNTAGSKILVGAEGNEIFRISKELVQARTLSGGYYPVVSARDGSSSVRAATSAWEIKKTLGPRARTGYYYLKNPYDGSVNTWWCDMTTDGGGWILVAHTGEGAMADQGTGGDHWYSRNNKGGFDTIGSGYYTGGGYWRATNGAWAENTCGQLMWDVRTHLSEFNNRSNDKVVFNWNTDQALPTGNSGYSNIPNAGNRKFNDWCYAVENAPGFNPSQYHQNIRNNTINGANYFTEHMVMTWSMRGTGGGGDAAESGPYWMIGTHANGLHQHYEESLSGDATGDGSYQVVSNEDTGWGGGGTNNGYRRIARDANAGTTNVWLR